MKKKLRGGCSCGKVRYQLLAAPICVHCCHCTDCQRHTVSAFVLNAIIETSAIRMIRGRWKPPRFPVLMVHTTAIAAANVRLRFGVTTGTVRKSDSFALERSTTRVPFDLISISIPALKSRGLSSPREHPPLGTFMTRKRSGRTKVCNDLRRPLLQVIANRVVRRALGLARQVASLA